MSRLIHPRLIETLEGDFFPQLCDLLQPSKAQDTSGEEIITYAIPSGYEAIPCRVAQSGGSEQRTALMSYLNATNIIMLAGRYTLDEEWKAEVNGQQYEILRVDGTPEETYTSLFVRVIR